MMKYLVGSLCVLSALAGHASAADLPVKARVAVPDAPAWAQSFDAEARYISWRSTYGYPTSAPPFNGTGRGSQFYMPLAYSLVGNPTPDLKLEFLARAGYVWAQQRTAGFEGSVSTATDTALSGTVTYLGLVGLQPFFSMNINAPTGKAALYGASRFARMDPDLVDVPTYGEGLNIGPTAGVNIPVFDVLLATVSVGHTVRNAFDKEGQIDFVTLQQATNRMKPGDVTTGNASLAYAAGALTLQGGIAYSIEQSSFQDNGFQYRAGDRYILNGSLGYAWSDAWRSSVVSSFSHSYRNRIPDFGGSIIPEQFNSNSNVFRVSVDHTYNGGNWSLGPTASYLKRDKNAYDSTTFQFVPAKDRYALGAAATFTPLPNWNLRARAEHIWTEEKVSPDKIFAGFVFPGTATPALSSRAWLISGGATINF